MIDSINSYTPTNQAQSTPNTKTEKSENAELFKELLGIAVKSNSVELPTSAGVQGLASLEQTDSIDSLSALPEISSINNITFNNQLSDIENKTDGLLEKLSLYSSRLEDPKVSLKDMDSLIQEINVSADNLLKETQDSGNADQELMNIVRECAIAAHSEYIKFQRGDYLDSFA